MHSRFRRALFPLCLLIFTLSLGAAAVAAQTLDYNYLFVSTRAAGVTEDGLAPGWRRTCPTAPPWRA